MTITSPADGGWYGGSGSPVTVDVQVAAASQFGQPANVLFAEGTDCSAGAQLSNSGGTTWTGNWQPYVDAGDRLVTLCAQAEWPDGGVVGTGNAIVHLDVTPPTVNPSLSRQPTDMTDPSGGYQPAFARDEDPVTVGAGAVDTGSGVASVSFALAGEDGGDISGIDSATGVVTLQTPSIGEHAIFTVTATAVDRVGNSNSATIEMPITRWKWVETLSDGGNSLGIPAVGPNGTIYEVVVVNASFTDNVFAFRPDDAGSWSKGIAGTPQSGPALSPDGGEVFVVTPNAVAVLNSLGQDAGVFSGLTGISPQFGVASAYLGTEATPVAAIEYLNGSTTEVSAVGAGGLHADQLLAGYDVGGLALGGNSVFAVFDSAANTIFSGKGEFQSMVLSQSAQGVVPGVPLDLNEYVIPNVGPVLCDGGAFLAGGDTVIHINRSGPNPTESPAAISLGTQIKGEIVLATPTVAYVPIGTSAIMRVTSGSNLTQESGPTQVGGAEGLLLATHDLYAASGSTVSAINPDAPATAGNFGKVDWSLNLTGLGPTVVATAAPAISCSANHESLLLLPTNGSLVGIVIDEQGLNAQAPWPKARHDAFNSANTTTPLLTCP